MPRAGRAGAAAGSKSRKVSASQRPAARKGRGPAAQQGFGWKTALSYAPLAMKLVLAVALGLVAFVGYRTAASASFFKVRPEAVDVQGASRASRDDIKTAVLRLSAAGVWDADLEAISRELRTMPWVRGAVVTRVMPSGLRVRVTERTPLLIARNEAGRLVWADDEGVMLGAATPGEDDFFVRGLEEAQTEQARRHNRERMALASELKQDWTRAGLSRRVSELNVADPRDVRVQLAGDDSLIEVRLGSQDYARRFRQALEKLDETGRTRNGECVAYVVMSTGRNAIFGYRPCGAAVRAAGETAAAEGPKPRQDAPGPAATQPKPARAETKRAAAPAPVPAKPEAKKPSKRDNTAGRAGEATRPRRVG
jgi:cell division septal protein FtsQ